MLLRRYVPVILGKYTSNVIVARVDIIHCSRFEARMGRTAASE